jgi:integrase
MPSKRLTEEGVAKLKPPPMRHDAKGRPFGTVDYFDAHTGLVLRVNYGGRKTWRALYYIKGINKKTGKPRTEPRTRPLGRYPKMSVKEARLAAKKFDPQSLDRAEAGTFTQVAEDWVRKHVDENGLRSKKEIVRQLTRYVYPEWGHRLINDIRRKDVISLLDDIKDKHGRRQADAVLGTIRGVMTWYADRDEDFRLPLTGSMRADKRKASERARAHYLSDDEIRALFKACDNVGRFGVLVKVLLLTGQRLRKCAHMRWDDVSAEGVWTIPTARGEKGNAGRVKLPKMVLDLIHALPRVANNPYVFPAAYGGGPVSAFGVFKRVIDEHLPANMRPWRLHDLRRTASTCLAAVGVPDHITERTLGHQLQGIQAIYNRHPYFEEKSAALERLAAHVDRIIHPPTDNVVAMTRGRRRK